MVKYRRRRPIGKIVAKRTGSKTAGNVEQTAQAGYGLAKRIARLINVEVKHYDTNASTQTDYSGAIHDLCDPAQGHDQDERGGDSVKPLQLTLRGYMYPDSTGGDVQQLRVIIFRYKDENGATLTPDDILDPGLLGSTSACQTSKNWDKRFHSKILYDKVFTIGKVGSTVNIPSTRTIKITKKLYGHINWADSTSTEEGGGLYMLTLSNTALTADSPTLQWVSRVTYTDN